MKSWQQYKAEPDRQIDPSDSMQIDRKEYEEIQADARPQWRPIETAPKDEIEPFLIRRKVDNGIVIIQVSNFQGDMYPDAFGGNVDYNDRILDAIDWMPIRTAIAAAMKKE